jgi:hypothetical protein
LVELAGFLSKHGEDGFGGITGLKPWKERMLGEVLLSLVSRLYFSKATLKMEANLEWEVDVEATADILTALGEEGKKIVW